MSDLISRQAAIDALHMHLMYRMGTDSNKKRLDEWINNLPSAQPEKSTTEEKSQLAEEKSTRKLIYLDDAIDTIEAITWYHQNRNNEMVSGANSSEHQAWYKAEDVYKALEELPSAQQKTGKWIEKEICETRRKEEMQTAKCSNCKKYLTTPHIYSFNHYNYCPHCGTKMGGEK